MVMLPPYGSLNGRAGHPGSTGMTETHNIGLVVRNHLHKTLASGFDLDQRMKHKRSGSSGDEVDR